MGCCGQPATTMGKPNHTLCRTVAYGPLIGPVTQHNYGTLGASSNFWCQNADVEQLVASGRINKVKV